MISLSPLLSLLFLLSSQQHLCFACAAGPGTHLLLPPCAGAEVQPVVQSLRRPVPQSSDILAPFEFESERAPSRPIGARRVTAASLAAAVTVPPPPPPDMPDKLTPLIYKALGDMVDAPTECLHPGDETDHMHFINATMGPSNLGGRACGMRCDHSLHLAA